METKSLSLEQMENLEGGSCLGVALACVGILAACASPVGWAMAIGAAASIGGLIDSARDC